MDKKTIISKIRKLKALSESSNPHEADTAKRLAAKLMEAHGINEKEVGVGTDAMVKQLLLSRGTHLTRYEMELALSVADANDCVAVFYQHPEPEKVFAVGEKEDTLSAFEQYRWLLFQVEQACKLAARRMERAYSFYWKRSFWAGALQSLDDRFEELKKENEPEPEEEPPEEEKAGFIKRFIRKFRQKEETPETSLAKRDPSSKAEDWAKDELKVGYEDGSLVDPGAHQVDGMAYRAGMVVGEKIDLLPGETKELGDGEVRGYRRRRVVVEEEV